MWTSLSISSKPAECPQAFSFQNGGPPAAVVSPSVEHTFKTVLVWSGDLDRAAEIVRKFHKVK